MPSKPYTFAPSTAAKADEVNANFDTLYSALNTDYVTRYSADFLAVPTCTDPPTVDSQLANKQYVDQRAPDTGILAKYVSTSNVAAAGGVGAIGGTTLAFTPPTLGGKRALRFTCSYMGLYGATGELLMLGGPSGGILGKFSVTSSGGRTFVLHQFDNTALPASAPTNMWLGWNGGATSFLATADGPFQWVVEAI